MIDKNLFLYNLAITAIFKDEALYLKEWIDYHLLAGVEHFYLYNNDSTDDYKEILAPYVEKNLVTLTDVPGRLMMFPAYHDAIDKYRFECRYMAFIDIDEFIYPKTNKNIVEVIDEILSQDKNAAGLGINWQLFGSSGLEKADYSRGVLERFTRRAESDWSDSTGMGGNTYRKTIDNPRLIRYRINPHFAYYFDGKYAINSNGEHIEPWYGNKPICVDKIVLNHYYAKSKEEYINKKMPKGSCCMDSSYNMNGFHSYDCNEVFDDGILKYQAARAENFSLVSDDQRINRVVNTLFRTLNQNPNDMPSEFFNGKLETFLTCRAVAEKLDFKIGEHSAEEYALAWIYHTLKKTDCASRAEIQMFLKALPEILSRPFPICKDIKDLAQNFVLPGYCEHLKNGNILTGTDDWKMHIDMLYMQKLLISLK